VVEPPDVPPPPPPESEAPISCDDASQLQQQRMQQVLLAAVQKHASSGMGRRARVCSASSSVISSRKVVPSMPVEDKAKTAGTGKNPSKKSVTRGENTAGDLERSSVSIAPNDRDLASESSSLPKKGTAVRRGKSLSHAGEGRVIPGSRRTSSKTAQHNGKLEAASAFAAAALVRGSVGSSSAFKPVGAYPGFPPQSPSGASVSSSVGNGLADYSRSAYQGSRRPSGGFSVNSGAMDAYSCGSECSDLEAEFASRHPADSMDWSEISSSLPPSMFGASLTPSCNQWDGGSRPGSSGGGSGGGGGVHQHLYPSGCSLPGRSQVPPELALQLPGSKYGSQKAERVAPALVSRRSSHEGGGFERTSASDRDRSNRRHKQLASIMEQRTASGACSEVESPAKKACGVAVHPPPSGQLASGSRCCTFDDGHEDSGSAAGGVRRHDRQKISRLVRSSSQLPGGMMGDDLEEEEELRGESAQRQQPYAPLRCEDQLPCSLVSPMLTRALVS